MATLALNSRDVRLETRPTLAYRVLLVFSFLYFARPEDVIPGLNHIPTEKIVGGIALLALIFGVRSHQRSAKWPTELKLLLALFTWQCMSIPFAFYRTGALMWVINKCSKALIAAFLVSLIVDSISQVRQLILIQAAAVAAMTLFSVLRYHGGRMGGVLGGVFDNPNDLAMNIALNWPLCWMFLLSSKNPLKKALWAAGMLIMVRGVMLTYSRSGFLALLVGAALSLWEFGVRGKRYYLLGTALFLGMVFVILGPSNYSDRIKSIFSDSDRSMDNGGTEIYGGDAREARIEMLKESLAVTATHPIFGVGPGQFEAYTNLWHVAHNTYTELSADTGVPALGLFIGILVLAFRNLRRMRLTQAYKDSEEFRLLVGGLWAGMASYVTGAMFANTGYQLFPYFMVGYTTALIRLLSPPIEDGLRVKVKSSMVSANRVKRVRGQFTKEPLNRS